MKGSSRHDDAPPLGDHNVDLNIDLKSVAMEEVFHVLDCSKAGLTSAEAARRLEAMGPNKLEEIKENWQDFVGIVFLLFVNSTISYLEERHAGQAADEIMKKLAARARVLRDGSYEEMDAVFIVPGDIIAIKLGDIVPADCRLLEGDPLLLDESAMTGESLPATKHPGEEAFSGSVVKQGEIDALVIATGKYTLMGHSCHLTDTTRNPGHFQEVLRKIGNFCFFIILVGILGESIVMVAQHTPYRTGVENLVILLIGGIPIAMPTVLSVTMAIGSHALSSNQAVVKRMTAIEELAGMDILCSDKTGTLTLNQLTVDKNIIEVVSPTADKDLVLLTAAQASRLENQDAIDKAIISMLDDPQEARAGIKEVHFLPFNPVDKRTAITYLTPDGKMHRATKGAPEHILALVHNKYMISEKVHTIIDHYAERGLRALAVAYQEVPEGTKESSGGPWEFLGLLSLFDPPRLDTGETVSQALELGVAVKMITGDQLAIAKETARRLGMGTNIYPASVLFGSHDGAKQMGVDEGELCEQADGFAGVLPEHKHAIVSKLQKKKHICGMTGDGVNDAPALKKADIGIAVHNSTEAAQSAADIVLTAAGLSVIILAIITSREIFQRMKNYTIYALSITVRIVLSFFMLLFIWKYNFSPFMVLVMAILNDGTIMTISTDKVKPSQNPDSWKLPELFVLGMCFGVYLATGTVVFYWLIHSTSFFEDYFHVDRVAGDAARETSIIYLQISIISQALIFVTRSQSFSFLERPGRLLVLAFVIAQLVATVIAVYGDWGFANMKGCGWGWAGVTWLYNVVTYPPLDILKIMARHLQTGKPWELFMDNKTAFTRRKNYGRDARQAQWAVLVRPGDKSLSPAAASNAGALDSTGQEAATNARRRAEIARLAELYNLKGHAEAVAKFKELEGSSKGGSSKGGSSRGRQPSF
ncbi:hypothetical protein GOP47_0010606 [Adiantum capillus-veneris]|uniref:Plasma membrane ATPase n=1 Tax=Adiantum capillus-veneris TaxID=13818 RepID=A0A9D4UVL8_ADICA|nr:hypothetical protein GOP47_0010606 [Adiantum capillus-veneris]